MMINGPFANQLALVQLQFQPQISYKIHQDLCAETKGREVRAKAQRRNAHLQRVATIALRLIQTTSTNAPAIAKTARKKLIKP